MPPLIVLVVVTLLAGLARQLAIPAGDHQSLRVALLPLRCEPA
jgi:hypothetical protein